MPRRWISAKGVHIFCRDRQLPIFLELEEKLIIKMENFKTFPCKKKILILTCVWICYLWSYWVLLNTIPCNFQVIERWTIFLSAPETDEIHWLQYYYILMKMEWKCQLASERSLSLGKVYYHCSLLLCPRLSTRKTAARDGWRGDRGRVWKVIARRIMRRWNSLIRLENARVGDGFD